MCEDENVHPDTLRNAWAFALQPAMQALVAEQAAGSTTQPPQPPPKWLRGGLSHLKRPLSFARNATAQVNGTARQAHARQAHLNQACALARHHASVTQCTLLPNF